MKRRIVRAARNVAGMLLILLGVISGFLPILQGWVFIVLGLGLIDHPFKHRVHEWLSRRSQAYRTVATQYLLAKQSLRKKVRTNRSRTDSYPSSTPRKEDRP